MIKYEDVNQFVHVVTVYLNRLKLMCRKQTDQMFIYKPLGVLKRSMGEQPTYGETNAHITTTGVLHNNASVSVCACLQIRFTDMKYMI